MVRHGSIGRRQRINDFGPTDVNWRSATRRSQSRPSALGKADPLCTSNLMLRARTAAPAQVVNKRNNQPDRTGCVRPDCTGTELCVDLPKQQPCNKQQQPYYLYEANQSVARTVEPTVIMVDPMANFGKRIHLLARLTPELSRRQTA